MEWSYGSVSGAGTPDPEQLRAWQRRMSAPDNEVPAAVPISLLLGRTDDLAVALSGARVYSTGLSLDVAVRLRRSPSRVDGMGLHQAVLGFPGEQADGRLLLGVEYADGRTAANVGAGAWPPGSDNDEPVLVPGGGGGGGRRYDHALWLSPLPGPGPLALLCAWPERGLPETRTVVDGDLLLVAARDVVVLWPDEPESDEPLARPGPDLPSTGWFGRAVRREH